MQRGDRETGVRQRGPLRDSGDDRDSEGEDERERERRRGLVLDEVILQGSGFVSSHGLVQA